MKCLRYFKTAEVNISAVFHISVRYASRIQKFSAIPSRVKIQRSIQPENRKETNSLEGGCIVNQSLDYVPMLCVLTPRKNLGVAAPVSQQRHKGELGGIGESEIRQAIWPQIIQF